MLEVTTTDMNRIIGRFDHLEASIKDLDNKKQNKWHSGLVTAILTIFLTQGLASVWYLSQMSWQVQSAAKYPYNSLDFAKDSALIQQRFISNERVLGRQLDRQDSLESRLNVLERTIGFK